MIRSVVVAHNKFKPLTHAFWPLRLLRGCNPNAVVSGFFIAPVTTSVPHTLISIYMDGVGENIGQRHHPVGNPRRLCAWYCIRQGDKVRQAPYRMKRILKGKLVHSVHGLKGRGFSPLGKLLSKGK
jgi:hypothetical protein